MTLWRAWKWKASKRSWPIAAGSSLTAIGVLSLQGQVGSHLDAFGRLGVEACAVRTPAEIANVEALVIPGGESTTMWMLAESSGCFDAISDRLGGGMPVFGTCAGMIMLAAEVLDGRPDQRSFGAIDIAVRRNAFGRQIASFEADLELKSSAGVVSSGGSAGGPFRAVFIRAPWVERVGDGVEVLATVSAEHASAGLVNAELAEIGSSRTGNPKIAVLCRAENVLVSSFHPELTDDLRIHQMFLELVAAA